MRKIFYSAVALLTTAMAFVSCEKGIESNDKPNERETITLTATTESAPKTRTTLGGTEMNEVHWTEGDIIHIYAGNSGGLFTATPKVDKTKASITGVNLGGILTSAIYPAAIADKKDENKITLLAGQTRATGNVSDGAMPMYAEITADAQNSLTFKNLCGIVELQLTGTVRVKSIEFISTDYITGTATISYNDGDPTMHIAADGAGKSITLDCGESGVLLDETVTTYFHIVVPPTNVIYFTIKITDTAGGVIEVRATDHTNNRIDRNKIITMQPLDITKLASGATIEDWKAESVKSGIAY